MRWLFYSVGVAAFAACAAPPSTRTLEAPDAGVGVPAATTERPPVVPFERVSSAPHEGARIVLGRAAGRDVVLVSDEDGGVVRLVDLGARKAIASFPVRRPGELLMLADGTAAVAARGEDAIVRIELRSDWTLDAASRWPTAQGPVALASSLDDRVIYAASTDARVVEGFRPDGTHSVRAETLEAPRALAVTDDGAKVLVAHAGASEVLALDAATGKATTTSLDTDLLSVAPIGDEVLDKDDGGKPVWRFGNGMGTLGARRARGEIQVRARHAYAFVRAGSALMIAHEELLPDPTPRDPMGPPMDGAGGYGGVELLGAEFQQISLFDARTGKSSGGRATIGACRLPRGAAFDAKIETLFVACSGDDRLVPFRRFEGLQGSPGSFGGRSAGRSWRR